MAYSRWGRDSDWNVFWESTKADDEAESTKPKAEERLAIWCSKHKETPTFTYVEVCEMLASGDFSRIAGFDEESRPLLTECMT